MSKLDKAADAELERLRLGHPTGPAPSALATATVSGADVEQVRTRAIEVVLAIAANSVGRSWPTIAEWRDLLPRDFVAASPPAMTQEEAEAWLRSWRGLSPAAQAKAESDKRWPLEDWLYWMEPENRTWHWWDASSNGPGELVVRVLVDGFPTPLGSLSWLLRACGAESVTTNA